MCWMIRVYRLKIAWVSVLEFYFRIMLFYFIAALVLQATVAMMHGLLDTAKTDLDAFFNVYNQLSDEQKKQKEFMKVCFFFK
jgi:hypothetical protein